MFWKFDLHTASQLEKLLEKEDVTLQELLDEEDVLQECKAQNQRLLLFLTQESSLLELVHLITHEPPTDREEKLRYKYANTACELLTCDVAIINDKAGEDDTILHTLYSFLEQEPPLNPLLASFFSKTFGNLISRKTEQTISFLRRQEGFITLVLKHMDTSALMDLLLRLISCVEPASLRQNVLTWLDEEKLIQRLTGLIQPNSDNERQSNASQTLCDIIRMSRDQASVVQETSDTDPLLATVELQQTVEGLFKNMFEGEKSEVCIVNGTQVLLALLESRKTGVEPIDSGSQGLEKSYSVNNSILLGIQPHLKHFHHLLLHPPKRCSMLTTLGILEEPFGNARLHACRLVAALLSTNAPRIHHELCQLDMINLLLDLFFKFTWNNFLHVQVEQCVSAILNQTVPTEGPTQDSPEPARADNMHPSNADTANMELLSHQDLVKHLFQKCRLVQRILDAWEENDKTQAEGGMRRGYMGHLTRIANAVVQSVEKGPVQALITNLINELPIDYKGRWQKFVDETLMETNKKNAVDLVFSDYQIQQMTANFVDQFGFNDDEFGEHDDSINATFKRITGMKCNLVDQGPSASAFSVCSKEKVRQLDDADEEEDIWEDKEINYAAQVKARTRFGVLSSVLKNEVVGGAQRDLGSPDLELFPEPKQIPDTNQGQEAGQGWVASFEDDFNFKADFASVALDTGSGVWGSPTGQLSDGDDKGWATFTDFQPFCCSDSGPRCSSPVDSESQANVDKDVKGSATCVWSVCGTRKAPLVASDSSSSCSDSEEEEERSEVVMETITTGSDKEPVRLTMDTKNMKALFTSEANAKASSGMATSTMVMSNTDTPPPKEPKAV
ncbi:serine/threonine-protein phosphatase 6 regulatory subunit 2 isoform X1 [Electrophorus electricus]|uniref:serine/threonine-protein phosphatase 6 regulatory subunit 2 isoform X1 n=2 Tax=Electrophorus electricus TaxID=8005 RepID=UPI0015CFA9E8|nr:serine/threonine-protein phosphatase 6 regulatory subunit 2 isoform X1 [Electrophorus electricus]XP_026855402.2 serine/threonine-protein phosphatase 6 regulatory subunit 2 isoform X1 [Electrophorus electricus]XP_026855403.2 serine/threonine-protein phosphatase 6 regulatory subunit 2 isoform X1 [Electrophorus electricus]XP_026855404.2 serine/threonine-protein phosphatase 6 regulatory subunit 2 isoform X1 [Electrophorus electricus]